MKTIFSSISLNSFSSKSFLFTIFTICSTCTFLFFFRFFIFFFFRQNYYVGAWIVCDGGNHNGYTAPNVSFSRSSRTKNSQRSGDSDVWTIEHDQKKQQIVDESTPAIGMLHCFRIRFVEKLFFFFWKSFFLSFFEVSVFFFEIIINLYTILVLVVYL